ncbi:hypothetical protein EXN65_14345 [Clostridium botulinum]|uniref:Uncharacterized protein n=2 Tax=Clostridium botulinum TaxID=1491 RepID=A0A846I7L4_CLOBO|nr:hypothetical protein [Clostridium botulinum]ACQ51263.1 hypothetical protein CLJ_0024 [Clostridium botulinum Ba4 str. 657]AJE13234.1 hypothetical protein T259_4233 [Clostridium botulinum CDC_1436]AXG90314.1 hypothetical protein AGE29_00425 [Clostridium botulinum]EDT84101.1 hypothetical protein CBB_A0196 [Clostridium botulinum Bf]MBY6881610.1 hypothetical protein [Clostridium botulinum]
MVNKDDILRIYEILTIEEYDDLLGKMCNENNISSNIEVILVTLLSGNYSLDRDNLVEVVVTAIKK